MTVSSSSTREDVIYIFSKCDENEICSLFSYSELIGIYSLFGGSEDSLLSKNRNKSGVVQAISNTIRIIHRSQAFNRL